jgi:predicted transcriptional regulator
MASFNRRSYREVGTVQLDHGVPVTHDATRTLLISIHSHYAQLILSGTKRVELRRRFDPDATGGRMLIYATLPTAAVIGHTRIERVEWLCIEDIWQRHASHASIPAAEFDRYFNGAERGFAILLADPKRYSTPISLDDMRSRHGLSAPQSYVFLREAHRELIEHEQD